MTDKMQALLAEAEQDAAFAERLKAADSPEALRALAKEKGLELAEADLLPELPEGELPDEALEDVAGGLNLGGLIAAGVWKNWLDRLLQRGGGQTLFGRGQGQGGTQPRGKLDEVRLDDIVFRGDDGPKITYL